MQLYGWTDDYLAYRINQAREIALATGSSNHLAWLDLLMNEFIRRMERTKGKSGLAQAWSIGG